MDAHEIAENLLCSIINIKQEEETFLVQLLSDGKYNEILDIATKILSQDQLNFYNAIFNQDRKYYILTGLPGTGKSFLQNTIHLRLILEDMGNFLCLAPTNLIAFQQHGRTIHSALKDFCRQLDLSVFKVEDDLVGRLTKTKEDLQKLNLVDLKEVIASEFKLTHLDEVIQTILIDEGSMVSSLLFSLLDLYYTNAKFIIMVGPNQLPPVNGFPSCDQVIDDALIENLQTQMRFDKDCYHFKDFVSFFNDVISGNVDNGEMIEKMRYYYNKIEIGGTLADYNNLKEKNKILIVSTNKQRCIENELRLAQEEGPVYEFEAKFSGKPVHTNYNLESNLGIDKVLKIKLGVKCIVKCNDIYNGLIKGMTVTIVNVIGDDIIAINNWDREITINRYDFEINEYSTVSQYPIALFYSATAHTTQGKTLDGKVGISLVHFSDIVLKKSFFVAMTRVRHPKQLYMDKHPICFLTNSALDMIDIEKIKNVTIKKPKFDFCIDNIYNVTELSNFITLKNEV